MNEPCESCFIEYFDMKSVSKNNIGYSHFENFKEENFNFNKNIFNTNLKEFDIYGYFQSYKYFEKINFQILEDFKFKKNTYNISKKIINKITDPIDHVRRGII